MDVCQPQTDETLKPIDIRDIALITLLRGTGMRREELVSLELQDFDIETGTLEVRKGKGDKYRRVYLPQHLIPPVEDWLEIRGFEPGPLPVPKGIGKLPNIRKRLGRLPPLLLKGNPIQ